MLKICMKCNEVTVGGLHCSKCGNKTMPVHLECPHCKKEITVNDAFCKECGRPVQDAVNMFKDKMRKEGDDKEKVKGE